MTSRPARGLPPGAEPPPLWTFATQSYGLDVRECFDARMEQAEGRCAIDYGFHMIIGDVTAAALKEMDLLVNEGVTSFKLFMAYPGVFYSDDGKILRAMQQCAGNGGLMMMHAENGIAIDVLAEQAFERGETDPVTHGYVRRAEFESEATHRAIQLGQSRRCSPLHRAPLRQAGPGASGHRPQQRRQCVRRDLSSIPVLQPRGSPRSGLGRRRLRVFHAYSLQARPPSR